MLPYTYYVPLLTVYNSMYLYLQCIGNFYIGETWRDGRVFFFTQLKIKWKAGRGGKFHMAIFFPPLFFEIVIHCDWYSLLSNVNICCLPPFFFCPSSFCLPPHLTLVPLVLMLKFWGTVRVLIDPSWYAEWTVRVVSHLNGRVSTRGDLGVFHEDTCKFTSSIFFFFR